MVLNKVKNILYYGNKLAVLLDLTRPLKKGLAVSLRRQFRDHDQRKQDANYRGRYNPNPCKGYFLLFFITHVNLLVSGIPGSLTGYPDMPFII
jgi:hypothetical protein